MKTSLTGKRWVLREGDERLVEELVRSLGVESLVARVLYHRGIRSREQGRAFLEAGLSDLRNPLEIAGIVKAAERVVVALENRERICVYGDYDVDGVTATALMVLILRRCGGDVIYALPHRMEHGYGLHREVVSRIQASGTRLLITVDNGISAQEEVALAVDSGMDVIITDHHEPPDFLPETPYIVNPKLQMGEACEHFSALSGAGLAFALLVAVRALLRERPDNARFNLPNLREYLDLVTIGTIGDVVPLTGENRLLVKNGLVEIGRSKNKGIRALSKVAGLAGSEVSPGQVGFMLAPRINAAGRLGNAEQALRMLLSEDDRQVEELAAALDRENRNRQEIEKEILSQALDMIERSGRTERVIVLSSEQWHPGVIGIVASRIVERFYRPAILLTQKNGEGTGSGRSISGFSLYDALLHSRRNLKGFGGHKMAAGLTLSWERIEAFRESINLYAEQTLKEKDLVPLIRVDDSLQPDRITNKLIEELERLKPFGWGNPEPIFLLRDVRPEGLKIVGEEHLRFQVRGGGSARPRKASGTNGLGQAGAMDVIGFRMRPYYGRLQEEETFDLLCHLRFNYFNGTRSIQAVLVDLMPHRTFPEHIDRGKPGKEVRDAGVSSLQ
jgi:single-stranded-DNA-specific exonuclease